MAHYLIDTNVLLDGCFVSYSWSAKCLKDAADRGDSLFTTSGVTEEAKMIVAICIPVFRNPAPFYSLISQFLRAFDIKLLQDVEGNAPASIPNNDKFLWPTARRYALTFLTGDLSLLKAFRGEREAAYTPIELITMSEPAHRYLLGGVPPTPEAGTLYSHGKEDHWATNINESVNILHMGQDIFFDYNPSTRAWVVSGAAIDQSVEYICRSDFDTKLPKKVAITWSNGKLQIFDSSQQAASRPFCIALREFGKDKTIQIGNVKPPRVGFMGTIQALIFDDRPISDKLWKKIRDEGPAFTPQPFDNDRLQAHLRRM